MALPSKPPSNGPAPELPPSWWQDPTALTNEAVARAIADQEKLFDTKLDGFAAIQDTRNKELAKAVELLQKWRDEQPAQIRGEVQHLKDLHEEKFFRLGDAIEAVKALTTEKFSSVGTQFSSGGTALSAALQAQKESAASTNESGTKASEKMEKNFADLIGQGRDLLETMKASLEMQINDLKSRLDKGEGRSSIADPSTVEVLRQLSATVAELKVGAGTSAGHSKGSSDVVGWIFGGVGVLVGIGSLIALALKLGG